MSKYGEYEPRTIETLPNNKRVTSRLIARLGHRVELSIIPEDTEAKLKNLPYRHGWVHQGYTLCKHCDQRFRVTLQRHKFDPDDCTFAIKLVRNEPTIADGFCEQKEIILAYIDTPSFDEYGWPDDMTEQYREWFGLCKRFDIMK